MSLTEQMVTFVLCCKKRHPVTVDELQRIGLCERGGWSVRAIVNEDDDPPACNAPYLWMNAGRNVGAYRCFMGHQRIMKRFLDSEFKWAFILEDDAQVPDSVKLMTALQDATSIGKVVSLHGRRWRPDAATTITCGSNLFSKAAYYNYTNSHTFRDDYGCVPCNVRWQVNARWACGSLGYIVDRNSAMDIVNMRWDGMPVDIILSGRVECHIIHDTPLVHADVPSVLNSMISPLMKHGGNQ